jgi:hypothetical protein
MDMINLRKSLIPVWLFLFIMFWATSILSDVQKTLPPAPADSQGKCDQMEPQATSSDSSLSASMNPSIEKGADASPLPPPPLQIQESFGSGG